MTESRRIFLKQMSTSIGAGLITPLVFAHDRPSFLYKMETPFSLPRSSPEAQGISSEAISNLVKVIQQSNIEFHSLMIIRHGHVIAEGWWSPYESSLKHTLYSLSKSFTSTAIGFAVTEKNITVEDKVISFFPEDLPETLSENLKSLTIKHLLTMSVGQATGSMPGMREATEVDWVKTFLSLPIKNKPGTQFLYNTGATFMLSAIVQKVTGQTLVQYLQPRLFEPLGISNLDWETNPQGINTGGYGLRIKTEDIAKFGILYLNKGKWNSKQLLPEAWIEEATQKQIDNAKPGDDGDWAQGYGYQFWRCKPGGYRADGAFGQFCIVMEEFDTVIAITSESFDMGKSMKLIWENLLPAMEDTKLLENKKANEKLKQELLSLALIPPKRKRTSPVIRKSNRQSFKIEANELSINMITFVFGPKLIELQIESKEGNYKVVCGVEQWETHHNKELYPQHLFHIQGRPEVESIIAASATWLSDDVLQLSWRYIETAHHDTITVEFDKDQVKIKFQDSISVGNPTQPERRPKLTGKWIL